MAAPRRTTRRRTRTRTRSPARRRQGLGQGHRGGEPEQGPGAQRQGQGQGQGEVQVGRQEGQGQGQARREDDRPAAGYHVTGSGQVGPLFHELLQQWLEPSERLSQLAFVYASVANRSMADLGKLLFECIRHRESPLGEHVRCFVKADLTRAKGDDQRDLLPLPIPWGFESISAVVSHARDPTAEERRRSSRSHLRRLRGIGCWLLLCILSLNFMYILRYG